MLVCTVYVQLPYTKGCNRSMRFGSDPSQSKDPAGENGLKVQVRNSGG